jgi:hypothetical protein
MVIFSTGRIACAVEPPKAAQPKTPMKPLPSSTIAAAPTIVIFSTAVANRCFGLNESDNLRRMKTTRLAVLGAMAAVGCSFHVDFVPSNVQQEIGANHLSKSTARWTCDAGEELGLVGDRLFVASQDFLVPRTRKVSHFDAFEYQRSGDGWNFAGAAMCASYLVPSDPKGDLFATYGTLFETSSTSSTKETTYYTLTSTVTTSITTTTTTYDYFPLWGDICWPKGTVLDKAAIFKKLYRGAEPASTPSSGRRLELVWCTQNALGKMGDRPDVVRRNEVPGVYVGGAETAVVPQDMWIAGDGTPTLVRPDGNGFKITHRFELNGVKGFLYERAHVPVFVNTNGGQEAIYIFRWEEAAPPDDEPRKVGVGVNKTFALACAMAEAGK